ncbi:MAG: hypothetical protein R3F33_13180 [Planctomycetota bacterium]
MRNSILMGAVGLLMAGVASAQGDDCSTAVTIAGNGSFPYDTTGFTASGFAAANTCDTNLFGAGMYADGFFLWTVPADGDYTFDTEGSVLTDTQLAVYNYTDCATVSCLGNDDDSGTGLRSSLTLPGLLAGTNLLIEVGGYSTSQNGLGTLNISVYVPPVLPANDDCANAIALTGTGTFAVDATNATTSGFNGDAGCTLDSSLQDVFYTWTAPSSGEFTFETQDSAVAYDTRLSVYAGDCITAACLGADDDSGATWASLATIPGIVGGNQYLIQIGTYSASTTPGLTELYIYKSPDGTACDLGIPISGEGDFAYDTTGFVSTGFTNGTCTSVNQDFFFVWTAAVDGDYQIDTELTTYDTKLAVFSGSDCSATCVTSDDDSGIGTTSLVTINGILAGDTFLIQTGGYGTNAGPATLSVTNLTDLCNIADDSFEDNDDCATAAPITPGVYTGLFASTTDRDFYTINVPDGMILGMDLVTYTYDIDFDVYVGDCLATPTFLSDDWLFTNNSGAAIDVIFEAIADPTNILPCSVYDFTLTMVPDPCVGNDDSYEDNDDCATATPMGDGSYTGLFVSKNDHDHYSVCVAAGATLDVEVLHLVANGDIDAFLWDASDVNCGGGNAPGTWLDNGYTGSDNEFLSWTNTTGMDVTVVIEVNVWSGSASNCNNYDLNILGSGGCGFSSTYCTANVNSTGVVSTIHGSGSLVAADNNFTLMSEDLPVDQFMYYIGSYGQDQVNNPGGSNGNLCVGGGMAIARFIDGTGLTTGGVFSDSIDLSNIPLNTGSTVAIMAGETFNFQGWHRETGGQSNFTPGLEVTFQ